MSAKEMMARVRSVLSDAGISQAEFARQIKVSPQTLSGWMSGRNKPGVEEMAAMCMALNVSPSWLLTGFENMQGSQSLVDEDCVVIPILNIKGACGKGKDIGNASMITLLKVTHDWVYQHCGMVNKTCLSVLGVSGDSMSPTVEDGDAVVVDTSVKSIYTDAVFAFSIDNDMFIKRLQCVGRSIQVISDNPRYAPYMINPMELGESLQILGKVVTTLSVRKS